MPRTHLKRHICWTMDMLKHCIILVWFSISWIKLMNHRSILPNILTEGPRRRKILFFDRNIFISLSIFILSVSALAICGHRSQVMAGPDQTQIEGHTDTPQASNNDQSSVTARAGLSYNVSNLDLRDR